MKLEAAFNTFYDKIELPALSEQRICSAWARLHELLTSAYGLPDTEVFLQGSYANDTAVRPCDEDGELDIDLVAVCVPAGTSAAEAISDLREKLAADKDLSERLVEDEPGRPCVRLEYAKAPDGSGFHVDVVPAERLTTLPVGDRFPWPVSDPPLQVPMRKREQWRGTAPSEYTQYCQDKGEAVRRTVRELKRWRDVHDVDIKSIVLQVLIAEHHAGVGISDADAICRTLTNIRDFLGGAISAPAIGNPVLPYENLADRWEDSDFRQFLTKLDEAIALAEQARYATTERESHESWRELLGDDFPPYTDRSATVPPPPPPGHRSVPQEAPSSRVEWG
jgi:predicted nucleotidyltransferase